MRRTLVFDFDGTVAVGDGPVLAYADAAVDAIGTRDAEMLRSILRGQLAEGAARGFPTDVLDGYDLVRRFAVAAGLPDQRLQASYLASRRLLGTPDARVSAPSGLAALLRDLPLDARAVLVTNAPDIRIAAALRSMHLAGAFDETHTSAGKPEGLTTLIPQWLARGPVLSVGDIWRNDLEPAAALGAETALVGSPTADAHPTFHAPTMTALLPHIRRWLCPGPARSHHPSRVEKDSP